MQSPIVSRRNDINPFKGNPKVKQTLLASTIWKESLLILDARHLTRTNTTKKKTTHKSWSLHLEFVTALGSHDARREGEEGEEGEEGIVAEAGAGN